MEPVTDVQAHILQMVEKDPAFRERLIADPKGVIEAETGRVLPDDALVFVQAAITTTQQTVPSVDAPLTEDELIQVMGGITAPRCRLEVTEWSHTQICDYIDG